MEKWIRVAVVVLFCSWVSSLQAQNLVPNGDFESGYTGFYTDYTLWSATGDANTCDEAEYAVASTAYSVHSAWVNAVDHTAGAGWKYFVANGSSSTTPVVWQTTLPVVIDQPGTAYRFEAWITTVYAVTAGGPGPELEFQIGNGDEWFPMGESSTFEIGATPGEWRLTYFDGVFSEAGSYYVRLMNKQTAAFGNDFGVDDIYFGISSSAPSIAAHPVDPEPAAITSAPVSFRGSMVSFF
jgi:hypothetical protein